MMLKLALSDLILSKENFFESENREFFPSAMTVRGERLG
jgi:hypothetical protein